MFLILKIREKDKTISFRSQSRYYPIFYIMCFVFAVVLIICTYFLTTYAIFSIMVPEIVILFFYVKLSPHGRFKSFVNISGLCLQFVPIIATIIFILGNYLKNTMIPTIGAFLILSLYLIGLGVSIARLVLKYRESSVGERVAKN